MRPLVMEYLKKMGYAETYALVADDALGDPQKPMRRKNTLDEGQIVQQASELKTQNNDTCGSLDQDSDLIPNEDTELDISSIDIGHFAQLQGDSALPEIKSRTRLNSTVVPQLTKQLSVLSHDPDLANRGFLRSLLGENNFSVAREFA